MRLGHRLFALTGKAAEMYITYSAYAPTPVSLKRLTAFGQNACPKMSFNFLRHEIPVRLANIMQEIHLLPEHLLRMPSVQLVISLYERSFSELVKFEKADAEDSKILSDFTDALALIRNRHSTVVETMAQGVIELKERYGNNLAIDNQLQYFLDRFYMSRISIRMVINQHVLLFGDKDSHSHESQRFIGSIDPACNVIDVIKDAFENSKFLCDQYYNGAPGLDLKIVNPDTGGPDRIEMVYVPSHLYHILFELIKNGMRAVMEHKGPDAKSYPPIEILVCKGKEDVTIKVTDYGGGIPRSELDLVWMYTYTTATIPPSDSVGQAPLAGYGYGLPLSRLYARYFNGDLSLNSLEGYGTNALIFLKRRAADADELLPVFNSTSARQYQSKGSIPIGDWSNPAHTTGMHTVYHRYYHTKISNSNSPGKNDRS